MKFTVERKTRGRKVGKKCVAQKKSNRKRKACVRWVKVKGSFAVSGKTGKNTFKFRGRVGGTHPMETFTELQTVIIG